MMAAETVHIAEKIIAKLGYTEGTGWVPAAAFANLETHRFALQQAQREMGLHGAFCLMQPRNASNSASTPIVYLATADTIIAAQEIHRKVWSQGLVPFLIIVIPGEVLICSGFTYVTQNWEQLVHKYSWSVVDELPDSPLHTGKFADSSRELWDLRALRLKTSLFWHDHSVGVDGRVDRRLLGSLEGLSAALIVGTDETRKLSPTAANGLIGRFLYIYFLFDRKIIDQEWVSTRGHDITLDDKTAEWSPEATWSLFEDLDSIFNGSIFPLGDKERHEIEATHINLVRRVMKHGSEPLASGGEQLSFLDFYLGAIRTETLSAVYEQFLKNLRAGEQRRSGAFYTPPFLVDFVLDRLEEEKVLVSGVSVLDPAAGSGVFLVGAYRRMIERAIWQAPSNDVSLTKLRGILTQNIFGIERNQDACHVAAFSLYLTLLDYVSPRDLTRVAAGDEPETLFPPLIDQNIFAKDFFDVGTSTIGLPKEIDCIIGNPPWQALRELDSDSAKQWRDDHKKDAPIGKDQAAELFVWKAMHSHIKPDGILAFLIPAKSFINPTSDSFRAALGRKHTFVGAANFSHLRHRLFTNAKQATAAIFLRPRQPVTRDTIWIYSPWSVSQPLARNAWPWTMVLDRAEVQTLRHDSVVRSPRGWFDAFMLRPVDRHIRQFLDDKTITEEAATLEILCSKIGARISRGGNTGETGVDAKFLTPAPAEEEGNYSLDLFGNHSSEPEILLPKSQIRRVRRSYRNRFGGNVLLIPRSMKRIRVATQAVGYTSSTTAMFFDKAAAEVSERELKMLHAVGRYLKSDIGRYLVATTGRRWLIDRRNIEPKDLRALVIPITDLNDPRIDSILAVKSSMLTDHLIELLGLNDDFRLAIKEFLDFRIKFRDGAVPRNALSLPEQTSFENYEDIVHRTLDGLIGRKDAFVVETLVNDGLGIGAVATCFKPLLGAEWNKRRLNTLCEEAIDRYCATSANSFADSLAMSLSDDATTITMVKPLEHFRWTTDSAFSDSQQIIKAFMAESI